MKIILVDLLGNIKANFSSPRMAKNIFQPDIGMWGKTDFTAHHDIDVFTIENTHKMVIEEGYINLYFNRGDRLYFVDEMHNTPINVGDLETFFWYLKF